MITRRLIIIILLSTSTHLLIIPNAYGTGSNERVIAQSSYRKAEKFISENNLSEALQELDKAIALQPNDAKYREARGHLYLLLHSPKMAIRDFKEWQRIEPKNARACAQEGLALLKSDSPEEAAETFSKAIALDKKADYVYLRAVSLEYMNDIWAALNTYREAVNLVEAGEIAKHPFTPYLDAEVYVDLWDIYFETGFVNDALELRDKNEHTWKNVPVTEGFDLTGIQPDVGIQVGNPIPDFKIQSSSGTTLSRSALLGQVYVLFRWKPSLILVTLSDEWAAGPMDAYVIEDDVSIMLDAYNDIRNEGAELISVATRPIQSSAEGEIIRKRVRRWPLFEISDISESWLADPDYKNLYRVVVVDANGIIRLALLSKNRYAIYNSVMPVLRDINTK